MNREDILKLLKTIADGDLSAEEGVEKLSHMPSLDLECANIDTHRPLRNGLSEVIYGEGKSYDQIKKIVEGIYSKNHNIFGTRIDEEKGSMLRKDFEGLDYDKLSRTFQVIKKPRGIISGKLSICCAGTADMPVAEEAYRTASFFGVEIERHYDVGIAGLHRLISKSESLRATDVIIVVAGMEGALPSVVGGLFPQPIIAVPTSVGYGVSMNGVTTLHAMLSSCAEGIVVVNIDNGFGAACSAIRILNSTSNKISDR